MQAQDLTKRLDVLIDKIKKGTNFPQKKEYVQDIIDTVEEMIQDKVLNIERADICSYIANKFDEEGIDISYNWLLKICKDEQKGNYSKSLSISSLHEHKFSKNKCPCGAITFNGLIYTKEIPRLTAEEKKITKNKIDFSASPYTEYLHKIDTNSRALGGISADIVRKFLANKQTAEDIIRTIKELGKIEDMINEQIAIEAKLIYIGDLLDARERFGEYERVMAKLLKDTTHKIAHVAKILGISPKHGTNNIGRIEHYEKLKWFRACPYCGDDIADLVNEKLLSGEKIHLCPKCKGNITAFVQLQLATKVDTEAKIDTKIPPPK